jgi:acylphosphatase
VRAVSVVRRVRVRVRGRVQGVFFRETTRLAALDAGVAGFVRNLPDGSVEAAFEGTPEAVERLLAFVRIGPPDAEVNAVELAEEEPHNARDFTIS